MWEEDFGKMIKFRFVFLKVSPILESKTSSEKLKGSREHSGFCPDTSSLDFFRASI